jgi:hypothetical protein
VELAIKAASRNAIEKRAGDWLGNWLIRLKLG